MVQTVTGRPIFGPGESFKTGSEEKRKRIEALIEWLLTPESEREPRTKTAFAEQWGVTMNTLRNDLKEPSLQREIAARARATARVDRLPAILEALYNLAVGGDSLEDRTSPAARVSAAKVLLEWMDKTAGVRENETPDLQSMSDEELAEAAMRLIGMMTPDAEGS